MNSLVNTQRLLFYHQSTTRRAGCSLTSQRCLCNLIVPELHQFPEQSIPPVAGSRQLCSGPLGRSVLQTSRPESKEASSLTWLQICVPSFFFSLLFFVVSHLTGRDVSRCFESQDVVRTWWDPWGNGWTFEPVCRDGRGSTDSIKWPTASELSLMGVNIDIWAQPPTAIHLSNFANRERKQHPSVCDNSKQIDNRLFS